MSIVGAAHNQSVVTDKGKWPDSAEGSLAIRQSRSVQELKQAERQGEHVSISEEQLVKAIERALKAMQGTATVLNFSIHEKTKQIMVKVKDAETGEIIREIPPERNLEFLARVWEMAGLFVDERR
jgi:flagellar protein FlaG